MTKDPSLADWNYAVVMLTQALLGAVSGNFRLVCLERRQDKWHVQYWLQEEDAVDHEEIEDIDFEFCNFLDDKPTSFDVSIVGTDVLALPPLPTRPVYRRREREDGRAC